MAKAKKPSADPKPPATSQRDRKTMTLTLGADLTARFRRLAADYGKKPREARRAAERLIPILLDELEATLSEERVKQAQMEIELMRETLAARESEFEKMQIGRVAAGEGGMAIAQGEGV